MKTSKTCKRIMMREKRRAQKFTHGNGKRVSFAVPFNKNIINIWPIFHKSQIFWFHSHDQKAHDTTGPFKVSFKMGNRTVACGLELTYLPNPKFLSFSTSQEDKDVLVTIQVCVHVFRHTLPCLILPIQGHENQLMNNYTYTYLYFTLLPLENKGQLEYERGRYRGVWTEGR